jgi:protein TonB
LLHLSLFLSLQLPAPGERAGASGPNVQAVGSAAQVFGIDDRAPETPSAVVAAETPDNVAEEPASIARAEGPEREAEPVEPAPVTQADPPDGAEPVERAADARAEEPRAFQSSEAEAIRSEPAADAVVAPSRVIETEAENMAVPMRRPKPTPAERKPVSKPAATARKPDKKKAKPKRQRSDTGQGRRQSGARAASSRSGSGPQRTAPSPGHVRRYAGMVRARIARNRPSGRGRRGTAVVRFAVSRGGGLRYVRLIRSSGNGALDRAAVSSVRRAAPFPRPPRGMTAGQRTFSIPFRFR